MPIAVSCPSCSASFKVKDEYAGKRAKCPSCKEPLSIPGAADTVKMPPPAAKTVARPVVASKPKPMPVDDAVEDEAPKPKRRRDEDDEDAEEKPRSKRRREADEDAPKSKRRRRDDDDDTPKKKGSALPLILGIGGGVLLLCGGGCVGGWLWLKGQAEALASNLKTDQFRVEPQNNQPDDKTPVAKLTVAEFIRDHTKYKDKWVVVTGTVRSLSEDSRTGMVMLFENVPGSTTEVQADALPSNWQPGSAAVGDTVELKGKVNAPGVALGRPRLFLNLCELQKRTPK